MEVITALADGSMSAHDSHPIGVLIVDHHPTFVNAVARFIQHFPLLVVLDTVYSGEEALARASELQPQVVLLGLHIRGLSGLQTALLMRTQLPHLCLILLTLGPPGPLRQAARTSVDAVLERDQVDSQLIPAIVHGCSQHLREHSRQLRSEALERRVAASELCLRNERLRARMAQRYKTRTTRQRPTPV